MKTIFITLFKVTALAMIVASFFLALTNRYGESQWDPIQEIQQLKNQNRRDDAIDLVNFLKENQTHETDDLHKIEKEVAYSPLEWAKAFVWDGVVKGNVNDTYSGIGALAADFCLYGDIRDITKQTWNLLFDQENFDGVVGVLSEPPLQPIKATKSSGNQNSFFGFIFFPVIMGSISPVVE